jgi:translation initiation factor IF-2
MWTAAWRPSGRRHSITRCPGPRGGSCAIARIDPDRVPFAGTRHSRPGLRRSLRAGPGTWPARPAARLRPAPPQDCGDPGRCRRARFPSGRGGGRGRGTARRAGGRRGRGVRARPADPPRPAGRGPAPVDVRGARGRSRGGGRGPGAARASLAAANEPVAGGGGPGGGRRRRPGRRLGGGGDARRPTGRNRFASREFHRRAGAADRPRRGLRPVRMDRSDTRRFRSH